ncbi:hypothetical protein BDP27DRAFT_1049616 [Rhodocollybia butyracea]|uniref:Uncharacterized protein n=1 Tax=Rhodocollybia butyracea TaxID=206335 RepID=A0A9P5PQI2_9AGAR|nr:hypothetical protein BDP27DRAFT_1049616 [Rhodocollybia butyracea]
MSLPHQPVDVDFVANLVRRQGEELLRVRKELEESQRVHVLSFKALRSTEKQFDDLHMNSMHWHLQLGSMAEELAALKTENEAFLVQVEVARMNLLDDLRLVSGTLAFDSEPNADGHTTAPYTSDAMSRGSEFSARSISTASVEGEDYETAVVPPSPALNPPESSPANVAFPAAESQAERETIAAADTVEPSERPQSLPENVAVQEVEGQPEGQREGVIAAMDTVDPLRLPESWPVVGVIETTGVISASEGHTTPIIEAPPTPNDVATPLEISLQPPESSPERIIATTGAISASKGHTLPLIEALSPSDGIATPLGNDASSSAETNVSPVCRISLSKVFMITFCPYSPPRVHVWDPSLLLQSLPQWEMPYRLFKPLHLRIESLLTEILFIIRQGAGRRTQIPPIFLILLFKLQAPRER